MGTLWRGLSACALLIAAGAFSQAGDNAEIKALLDKAIKAAGGKTKIDGLKNLTWKGKMSIVEGTKQFTVSLDGTFQGWDRQRLEVEINLNGITRNMLLVIDGKKGWIKENNNRIKEIGKEIALFTNVVFAVRGPQLPTGLKDKAFQLSHLGELKVADQDAIGLRISRKDSPDVNIFFSKKTHLPLKADTRITDPQGKETNMEILFGDYKEFGGLKHFTKLTFNVEGKSVVLEVSDLQPGAQLDAGIFKKPE